MSTNWFTNVYVCKYIYIYTDTCKFTLPLLVKCFQGSQTAVSLILVVGGLLLTSRRVNSLLDRFHLRKALWALGLVCMAGHSHSSSFLRSMLQSSRLNQLNWWSACGAISFSAQRTGSGTRLEGRGIFVDSTSLFLTPFTRYVLLCLLRPHLIYLLHKHSDRVQPKMGNCVALWKSIVQQKRPIVRQIVQQSNLNFECFGGCQMVFWLVF